MVKTLTATSFTIAFLLLIVGFIITTTFTQLAVVILLYGLLFYLGYKFLPLRTTHLVSKKPVEEAQYTVKPDEKIPAETPSFSVSDIDKRAFLKLIGGASISFFLLSIFSRRAEGLFSKQLPGSGPEKIALEDTAGNKIDPAQNKPLDGYEVCEIENNVISFFGYTNTKGAWVVLRVDTRTASFRYCRGDSNFPGGWNSRENLKYDYFYNVF